MALREQMKGKPVLGIVGACAMVLLAAVVLAHTYWPEKKADLSQAFYTVDDGKTWFADSATKVTPFDHDGREAVVAHLYSYANGSKRFCAYVAKFTPEAKTQLESAIAAAARSGKPADSVDLFHDRSFMKHGVLVKPAGSGEWISYGDPKAQRVFTIHSPDGSEVDEVFAY